MKLSIAISQLNSTVGAIEANAMLIVKEVEKARQLGVDLLIFPELALTGYPPEDLILRKGFLGQVQTTVHSILPQIKGMDVIFGAPWILNQAVINAALVIRDGKILTIYAKQHLPNYAVFDEKRYFKAGDKPCVFECKGIPIGITICEDLWYKEPMQQAVEAGAKLMLSLNASPFHLNKYKLREKIIGTRAIEGEIPVVYAHCVGGQDELVFDGASMVIDNTGKCVARAPFFEETLMICEFDDENRKVKPRSQTLPSEPSEEALLYKALVAGVRDYVNKNHFKGVIIGLSGGVDSALTLAIAVDALGNDRVIGVAMPSRYSLSISQEDARAQAEKLGVAFHIIPIETVHQGFLDILTPDFGPLSHSVVEENIQARSRGMILMAISNKTGYMVITTGNKSELSVGYATLYGDMCGGFAALKDVSKTMVYRLSYYYNQINGEIIPNQVLTRPPSAELAPDQRDEDSLPPYDVLDAILYRYIEQDKRISTIVAEGFDEDTVKKIVNMVDKNEYKRRQAPPGIRVTEKAFGRDRRYPITSGYCDS